MWSKLRNSLPCSTVHRMMLGHAAVLAAVCGGIFLIMEVTVWGAIQGYVDHHLLEEGAKYRALFEEGGLQPVADDMLNEAKYHGSDELLFRVHDAQGRTLVASDLSAWKGMEALARTQSPGSGAAPRLETVVLGQPEKEARLLSMGLAPDVRIQMGTALVPYQGLLGRLRAAFLACAFGLLLASTAVTGWIARAALNGVEAIRRTAERIMTGDLSSRVPGANRGEEIDRLAATFNATLDRIQALVRGMREITDDIAHDLRSPLTRIRGAAELLATETGMPGEARVQAGAIVGDCDETLGMVNTLLDLSEAEAGVGRLALADLDLASLVRGVCDVFQSVAQDRNVRLEVRAESPAHVRGDAQQLSRVVANLLDNAFGSVPEDGHVTVEVAQSNGQASITVRDNGAGITEQDLPHIFERFYRADPSRQGGGYGLGLSLVEAIVKRHGGSIRVSSTAGVGSDFVIVLPERSALVARVK